MQTIMNGGHAMDWYMLGSWNISGGETKTVETVSVRDYTKVELLFFSPFAHNRFQPATFAPKYSLASYNQKVRLSWMWDGTSRYVDVEAVDSTHFKLTASDNVPGDTQILLFALGYYGAV